MKGVVVEIDNAKCIVLFNNGKIGSLPKPPHCEVGMVITVNFNRKIIMLPIAVILVLLIAGIMVRFALRGHDRGAERLDNVQTMSPELFCNNPFLREDIILPLSEYTDFDALFAHLGNPIREFSQDHMGRMEHRGRFEDKRKYHEDEEDNYFYNYSEYTAGDKVKGFNYPYYNIIAYYSQANRKVLVSEIILNSKEVIYNGNVSIGDDRKKIESVFSASITKHDDSFFRSSKDREMWFTLNNKVLVFKFNGKNQLSSIRIAMN
ncbi:MAG: hypothetical protein LBT00_08795 [Spirochaetaceae bacterium]|nr:hypothetical protein [Spirochaetaceae bacterium]